VRPVVPIVAALAIVVLGVPTARAPGLQPGNARAADCIWQRHTKRIVKRLHRHGRVRTVFRRRYWWTCAPVPPPAAESTPTTTGPAAPGPATGEPEPGPGPEANRVSVRAGEYFFVLSRPNVRTGEVTVELNNQGEDPHDLNLEREGGGEPPGQISVTPSQEQRVAQFALSAGTYRLWCSLPGHEERGMHATLVVE
jgi:plastocyanin